MGGTLDHSRVPVLEVLEEFRRRGDTVFEVHDHLRSGVDHGVLIPDAADPSVKTFRVVAGH
ncbi:hypothetical protein ACFYR1_37545 [Streptomyces canus]|uniref:hypothetical protein n=1 Tax=Streptomyces canus TaxID=58343 RepID=UPI00367F9FD5